MQKRGDDARCGGGGERSGEVGAAVQKWERCCKKRELRCKTEAGVARSGSSGERSEEVGAAVQEAGAAVREKEVNFMRATTNLAPFLMGKAKRYMETSRKSRSAFACPLVLSR